MLHSLRMPVARRLLLAGSVRAPVLARTGAATMAAQRPAPARGLSTAGGAVAAAPHSGKLLCLDLEGVLIPECWIALAEMTNIEALTRTTAHEPDYDVLMRYRLDIMDKEGLGMAELNQVISQMEPLPGALDFVAWVRERYQLVILSDTFYEFGMPFMKKLGHPTLFCHKLEVEQDTGKILDYKLRQPDPKRKCIEAFRSLNFKTIAAGDSYNDRTMLGAADRGIWYECTDAIAKEIPQFPVAHGYEQLKELILDAEQQIDAEAV